MGTYPIEIPLWSLVSNHRLYIATYANFDENSVKGNQGMTPPPTPVFIIFTTFTLSSYAS